MTLAVEQATRAPESVPDLWLAFAPVKRSQTDWLIEKATELGAARLIPLMTQRTVTERARLERFEFIAIEAAEQCGRTILPQINGQVSLAQFLEQRDAKRTLYFADETGGEPIASAFKAGPAVILTGPEGGFTPEERDRIPRGAEHCGHHARTADFRAETAALAALASYMAIAGDWRR